MLQAIERKRGLSEEEFLDSYLSENRPVVLEDAAAEWAERWTLAGLKEHHGDAAILCETEEVFVQDRTRHSIPLRQLIESIEAGSLKYRVRTKDFLSTVPGLQEEFERHRTFVRFLPNPQHLRHVFWIAPAGNRTLLHQDNFMENLNVQVYGRKQFILIAPSDYDSMYAHMFSESPVNPLDVDHTRFPKFQPTAVYEAVLGPGDMLYLPQFWWHYVVALEASINVNVWTKARPRELARTTARMPLVPRLFYRLYYRGNIKETTRRLLRPIHRTTAALSGKTKPN